MLFRRGVFSAASSSETGKIACLVCGLGGKIERFARATRSLQAAGYTVIVYEFDRTVLTDGDPDRLLRLIQQISDDFAEQSSGYDEVLATGVSLGAYIAFNVQRRLPAIKRGIYGTAGICLSNGIFTIPVFKKSRKAFEANGINEESLRRHWDTIEVTEDLELPSDKSLLIVMGGADRVVPYRTASKMMGTWRQRGIRVYYFSKWGLGHLATIVWYMRNLHTLLASYDKWLENHPDEVQTTPETQKA